MSEQRTKYVFISLFSVVENDSGWTDSNRDIQEGIISVSAALISAVFQDFTSVFMQLLFFAFV